MRRAAQLVGWLVILVSLAGNVALWRAHHRASVAVARSGLARADPALTAALDTLRRERAAGERLQREATRYRTLAAAEMAAFQAARAQLLAGLQPASPPGRADPSAPATIIPTPVTVDSQQLIGTLEACRAATGAVEAALQACASRAESADARAARAERLVLRADSARVAAVDAASHAIGAATHRSYWRDLRMAAIGAGVLGAIRFIFPHADN